MLKKFQNLCNVEKVSKPLQCCPRDKHINNLSAAAAAVVVVVDFDCPSLSLPPRWSSGKHLPLEWQTWIRTPLFPWGFFPRSSHTTDFKAFTLIARKEVGRSSMGGMFCPDSGMSGFPMPWIFLCCVGSLDDQSGVGTQSWLQALDCLLKGLR